MHEYFGNSGLQVLDQVHVVFDPIVMPERLLQVKKLRRESPRI